MTYEALKKMTVKRPDGTTATVQPGDRFEISNPATASRLIVEGKLREIQPEMTEARKRSLEQIMDDIILGAIWKAFLEGRRWTQTPEVDRLEAEIHATFERVLEGRGKLGEYRELINRWIDTGTMERSINAER